MLYMKLKDAYTEEAWTRVATLREELRLMLKYEEEGMVLRSRCQGEAEEERVIWRLNMPLYGMNNATLHFYNSVKTELF